MNITFDKVCKAEFDDIFNIVKEGIILHVDKSFGWDEDYQKDRYYTKYNIGSMHWIIYNRNKSGIIYYETIDNRCHVNLVIILPNYRNQGVGQYVMGEIEKKYTAQNFNNISLSLFKTNIKAINFYVRMGYKIIDEDEYFFSLEKKLDSVFS